MGWASSSSRVFARMMASLVALSAAYMRVRRCFCSSDPQARMVLPTMPMLKPSLGPEVGTPRW